MTEENWRLGLFVDERASDEQLEKLTAVFGGQKGGPMEAVTPLIGEMLGVEQAPFEVVEDGLSHSVKIGDAIDFEIEDIVPFGVGRCRVPGIATDRIPVGGALTKPGTRSWTG
jgi:hypothetical protein